MPVIEEGIYFGLPEADYYAADGLSNSGMKHLHVSPLHYWHAILNPDREPPKESPPQRWGKAVHCRLLEPARFEESYAAELSQDDYPALLVTIDDLKEYCAGKGLPTAAKRKQDLIDRITTAGSHPAIWDMEKERYEALTAGLVLFGKAEASAIDRLASVVAADPAASAALSGGMPEVSFFVRDPETGVMLKARMDYVKPNATIDLKTFSNSRGKPIDRAVFEAIYYEGYYVQSVHYHTVRELARQKLAAGEISTHGMVSEEWLKGFAENANHGFGFVFVESDEPFDLRVVQLKQREANGGDPNLYWMSALTRMSDMIQLYAECKEKYGDRPWREPQTVHSLSDIDLPQLMFA